jgi:hypothetical protein
VLECRMDLCNSYTEKILQARTVELMKGKLL